MNNIDELKSLSVEKIILASGLGARKAEEIAMEAEKLGIAILNKRKVESAGKISRAIAKKREEKAKAEKEKKKEGKSKEEKTETKGKEKEVKAREETGGERKAAGVKHETKGEVKGV